MCYAWFTHSTPMAANHFTVIKDRSLVKKVSFYPYYNTDLRRIKDTYTFSKTPLLNFKMGKYSLINHNYQVLIEVELTEEAYTKKSLDLIAFSNAPYFLGELDKKSGALIEDLKLKDNSLSSIICFYSFTENDIIENDNYYSLNINNTNNINSERKNFVNNFLLNRVVKISNYSYAKKLFIILDYDIHLIEYIYSMNLGNPTIFNIDNLDNDGNNYLSYNIDFYFSLVERSDTL